MRAAAVIAALTAIAFVLWKNGTFAAIGLPATPEQADAAKLAAQVARDREAYMRTFKQPAPTGFVEVPPAPNSGGWGQDRDPNANLTVFGWTVF